MKHNPKDLAGVKRSRTAPLLLCLLWFAAIAQVPSARAAIAPTDALSLFTNVAARLLRSECKLELNHIQVYPTNQYTAEVHRLLQVSANLYEATTNHDVGDLQFPNVFRPIFGITETEIYIAGYALETNTEFFARPWRDLNSGTDRPTSADDNVYGIPLIVGARKGWPSFNKFALQSMVQCLRKLEFVKNTASDRVPSVTNHMFVLGISNSFGLQLWNPYSNAFTQPLTVLIKSKSVSQLTNNVENFSQPARLFDTEVSTAVTFQGYQRGSIGVGSFQAPLLTNEVILPQSAFYMSPTPSLEEVGPSSRFESNAAIHTVNWRLTNWTRLALCLSVEGRLVDVVSLDSISTDFPISDELSKPLVSGSTITVQNLWRTNRYGGATEGVNNQSLISMDKNRSTDPEWRSYSANPLSGVERTLAIDNFRVFMGLPPQTYSTNYLSSYTTNRWQAPFSPLRRMVQITTWEANDPLVHYTSSDLVRNPQPVQTVFLPLAFTNLWQLNRAHRPWGGNPLRDSASDPTAYDPRVKDPLVRYSDEWDFPENEPYLLSCLGRIHRGTPWQTIYLKAAAANQQMWLQPNGPGTTLDTHPTNDWRLISILSSLLNTNHPQKLMSINDTNRALWRSLLDGVTVVSNISTGSVSLLMTSNSPQAEVLAGAIARQREISGGSFRALGDLLMTPEMTSSSPWINWLDHYYLYFLDEAAWEAIPSQVLPLLRADPVIMPRWASGEVQLQCQVTPGYTYAVEFSADLDTWDTLATVTPNDGEFLLLDSGTLAHRFYRIRQVD